MIRKLSFFVEEGADWKSVYVQLKEGLDVLAKAFHVERLTRYGVKITKIAEPGLKPGEIYEITATI